MTAPADIDGLSLEALTALLTQLLSKLADQGAFALAELREENARLKGSERATADQAKRHGRRE